MKNSKIEWCHHTLNLWWGCMEVHAGCDNCYARILAHRYGYDVWGKHSLRREIKSWETKLKEYQRQAEAAGEIHRVFIGSMMDIFEKPQPIIDKDYTTGALREKLFLELIPQCPNLEFLLLTKRPSNINKYIPEAWKTNPPTNVVFGTSPVNQETANILVPQLLLVSGRRFLSVEPQLDHVDLKPWIKEIGQVIVGGESGHGKRPFNPDWARSLRDQCKAAGTPFFMKQWDKVKEIPEDLMIREFPEIKLIQNKNQKSKDMITNNENSAMKDIVAKLSPFKKEIGKALLTGEKPEALAMRMAEKRKMPVPTAQAYVTMVGKLFEKEDISKKGFSKEISKDIVAKLSPFKKEIGEALLSGETPGALTLRMADKRKMPVPTAQAYVTMVRKLLENEDLVNDAQGAVDLQKKVRSVKGDAIMPTISNEPIEVIEGGVTTIRFEITVHIKSNRK